MESRYVIQWKPKADLDTPENWLYFSSYLSLARATARYENLVRINGRHFDYQVILTPGGARVMM